MEYQEIEPISREEAKRVLESGKSAERSLALIRLAYFEEDWRWVQNLCLENLASEDIWAKRSAITSLGHLARIHGQLDETLVRPKLEALLNDPEVGGFVEDALSDFDMFLR